MVVVTDYALRTRASNGTKFISLQLEGDPIFVQSMETGRFYLTSKRASITSTFSESVAKAMIGKNLPGSIVRVQTDPYDFTVPETGEVIKLAHSYQYSPEEAIPVPQVKPLVMAE